MEGVIQQGDGPNDHQRLKPQGGSGGMLPPKILKIRVSKTAFREL